MNLGDNISAISVRRYWFLAHQSFIFLYVGIYFLLEINGDATDRRNITTQIHFIQNSKLNRSFEGSEYFILYYFFAYF